ncbi:MAG: glycosyltransferase family 4 protein [Parabacteroides sp.]
MKQKAIIFHPALAPYRIDFFNSLNDLYEAEFYFEFGNALEQSFKQQELTERLHFVPRYLKKGMLGIKNLRLQILSILRRKRPDVVICSEYNLSTLLILLYKYLFQSSLRVYCICDDSCGTALSEGFVKKSSRQLFVRLLDGIILTNLAILDWYRTHIKGHTRLLYFPIIQEDTQFRTLLSSSLPIAQALSAQLDLQGKQVLLFVGRLIDIKNLHFLLKAFRQIHISFPKSVLLFVGEGNEGAALKAETDAWGLTPYIHFVGKHEGAELLAYYNLGQVFILPSYFERFGAVVNEALLAGCYTLCSSAAGAACLIQAGENGELFDPHCVEDLVGKLQIALSKTEPLQAVSCKPNQMKNTYDFYFQNLVQSL